MKNAGTVPTKTEKMAFYRKIRSFYRAGFDTAQSTKQAMAYVPMHVLVYMRNYTSNEIIRMAEEAGITIYRTSR